LLVSPPANQEYVGSRHLSSSLKCGDHSERNMLFMVIEKFKNGDARAVYGRALEQGRMLPDGLRYVESWVEANLQRCFQLVECDDPRLFQEWVVRWHDLVDFEIVPIVPSKQTTETINSLLRAETKPQTRKGDRRP